MAEVECCCRPYDPAANLIVRCWPRAMDMGHCRGEDFKEKFCCGGNPITPPTATPDPAGTSEQEVSP